MSKYISLFKYHFSIYIRSTKFVMPLMIWLIYLFSSYTIFPVKVVSSIVLSSLFLFCIMIWIGLGYYEIEDTVSEQIMILRTNNEAIFYISKIIFLAAIGFMFVSIGIIFPIIQNAIHGFAMYNRPITLWDIIVAFSLHFFAALVGGMLGGVFHPRIIKNRKKALLCVFLIVILSMIKISLIDKIPMLGYVMWILPPVSDYASIFSNKDNFILNDVGLGVFLLFVYSAVLIITQLFLLKRNKT